MTQRRSASLGAVLLIILIIIGDFAAGIFSSGAGSAGINLGVWNNFPNSTGLSYFNVSMGTSGSACSVGILSNKTLAGGAGDHCELFNSAGYRQALLIPTAQPESGISIQLSVNCITPATPTQSGTVLYIQYANYTINSALQVWENTSNFILTNAPAVYIDNTNGWDCPGNGPLVGSPGLLPSFPANWCVNAGQCGFVFRVVAVCACNSNGGSDPLTAGNPRFASLGLLITQTVDQAYGANSFVITSTSFRYQGFSHYPVSVSTDVKVQWIATNNGVAVESGVTGAGICTITTASPAIRCTSSVITFPVAFVGTPNVVVSVTSPIAAAFGLPLGSLTFFTTQIVTA